MRILALIAISSFLISCKKKSINCGLECGSPTEELLFQTSFTNTIITDGEYKNANFSGTDPAFSEKSDWDSFKAHDNIGYVEIGYEDGENNQRLASVVDDPDSTGNSVLKFQLMEASIKEGSDYKGRVQLSVHDNKCIKELYQTVKLKFHPDMAYFQERADRLYWFTLFEFWNNGAWTKEKYPFRVSVNLYKDEGVGSDINFRVKADYKTCKTCKWNEVWEKLPLHSQSYMVNGWKSKSISKKEMTIMVNSICPLRQKEERKLRYLISATLPTILKKMCRWFYSF
jgi:hypothetical protein